MPNRLHDYSKIVAGATFFLIAAGGLVTSTDSGLSVPDWPLSYGQVFPPMIGGIRFEHTHRLLAGLVGILTTILTVWVFQKESRRWVKALGAAALIAVVLQAVLGGITVIYLLPTAVSVLHACLAQTFFCLIVSIAIVTSHEWRQGVAVASKKVGSIHRLLIITTAFIYSQLILGAVVRHAHGAAATYHIGAAFLILLHTLFILNKISSLEETRLRLWRHSIFLGATVTLQIFLGFAAFFFTQTSTSAASPKWSEVLFTTTHQTLGALILASAVALTLRSFRLIKNRESAA